MKKKPIRLILGLLILLSIIGFNIFRMAAAEEVAEVNVFEVYERELSQSVITTGQLELQEEQLVLNDAAKGVISEVVTEFGASVEKGDLLLRYENKDLEIQKKQQEISIEGLYLKINQIIKQKEDVAQRIDDIEGKDMAAEREMLETELSQIETEERMANLELRGALLEQEKLEEDSKSLEVRSEIKGDVIYLQSPLDAQHGDILIHIGTKDNMYIKGHISQFDILQIQEGKPVHITTEAMRDKKWEGNVLSIGYLPDSYGQERLPTEKPESYPIYISIKGLDPDIRPGFQMTMEIETEVYKAITVPISAVVYEEDQTSVFIVEDDVLSKRIVETGIVHEDQIEIIEGVSVAEKVVIDPEDQLEEGMKVMVND